MRVFKVEIHSNISGKVLLSLILVLGLLLRLFAINQSLWLDEAISALAARDYSFSSLITKFSSGDTHPFLYYFVLRLWCLIFGFSEISLRMPSVIFGVLTVYVVYKIAEISEKKTVPIFSALLLSTAPLHIYYSQEVRMYAMSAFLVSLAFYLFLKRKFIPFAFVVLLLGLTDYLPLSVLSSFIFYFFVVKRERKFLKDFIFSLVFLLIFILVWFPILSEQMRGTSLYLSQNPWWSNVLGRSNLKELALVWVKFLLGRISFENKLFYFLIVLITSILFFIPLFTAFTNRRKIILVWLWFLLPTLIFFISSLFVPGFKFFRLIFVIPAFYILVSYGISKTKKTSALFILIFCLNTIFSLLYLSNPKFWREDWRGLVSFIEGRIKDNEFVLISYKEPFSGYKWYSKKINLVKNFEQFEAENSISFYSLDYLLDVTDPERRNYEFLRKDGFQDVEVFNFRGVGQVRYWKKK